MSYIRTVRYVNGGVFQTVAQLLANFPAGAAYADLYANVTDLYNNGTANGIREVLRCRYDVLNSAYRWIPQRQEFNRSVASTGGAVPLTPLVTAPTIILNGSLISNITMTPTATNAWVGQRYRIVQNSLLGLFITQITGLIGSNITLLGNTEAILEYTAGGWRQMTS